ncbi:hypothetical protein BU15DRAFT_77273 [Melanogaster broomeanus]|nr:hypothetical protein BU15DRAFT_77273 [Melanogaster broomeanus]
MLLSEPEKWLLVRRAKVLALLGCSGSLRFDVGVAGATISFEMAMFAATGEGWSRENVDCMCLMVPGFAFLLAPRLHSFSAAPLPQHKPPQKSAPKFGDIFARKPKGGEKKEMAHIDVHIRQFTTTPSWVLILARPFSTSELKPHVIQTGGSPAAHIPPANTTAPLNHPASIKVATVAPSSIASPIPLSAHASPQPPDLLSTTVAQAASCTPSSSTPAVTSTPAQLSLWKDLSHTPPQCPPQEDDLPLLDVLSPEEIRIIQEHRRCNGTSPDFSASPADDHQSPVYSALSTSPPAHCQSSVTPSTSLGPFPSSRQLPSPGVARRSTSPMGLDPSLSVTSPLLSMSPSSPSCLASSPQQTSTNTQPSELTRPVDDTPEPDPESRKQPTIGQHAKTADDDEKLLDCMIYGYKLDFGSR